MPRCRQVGYFVFPRSVPDEILQIIIPKNVICSIVTSYYFSFFLFRMLFFLLSA